MIQPTNFNNLDHEGVYLKVGILISPATLKTDDQVRFGLILLALSVPISTLFYTHQRGDRIPLQKSMTND